MLGAGCKKAPTFSVDNELDPESEQFKPDFPINLSINILDGKTEVHWQQSIEESGYIDGYVIYKSVTDSNAYNYLGTISSSEKTRSSSGFDSYIFTDDEGFNGIKVLYKIQSFYVQENDTAFSEPKSISNTYSSESYYINAHLLPFYDPPMLKLSMDFDAITSEAVIEIFTKYDNLEDYNLIGTYSPEEEEVELALNVNDPVPKYYFRVTLDSISTEYSPIRLFQQYVNLRISGIQEFSENEVEVNINFPSDTSSNDFIIDYYTLQIFETLSIQDSTFTLISEITNPFTISQITETVTNLDPSKRYYLHLFGTRGIYSTESHSRFIEYTSEDNEVEEINIAIPDYYYRSEIYFDANSD